MESNQALNVQPALTTQRIAALDTARGIAVLGILLINMYSFALPEVVRANPFLMVGASGVDRALWYVLHIFADTKFITMLSVVFGASLWLFAEHKAGSERQLVDQLQYRRLMWLLVFGLLHSYLLWDGDVLFTYAVCGWVVWHLRRYDTVLLLKISAGLFAIGALPNVVMAAFFPEVMNELMAYQTADEIAAEVAHYQQGWGAVALERIGTAVGLQLGVLVTGWSTIALMLVGIVLARCGLLTLQVSADHYRRLIALTGVPGLLLIAIGLYKSIHYGFAAGYVYTYGYELHFWGSSLLGVAYVLMAMLWCRAAGGSFFARVLAAVGRMSLSVYIMQSLICTLLFYGYGLGWYGQLSLSQVVLVTLLIWSFQCMFACWWLARFRYGPLEWWWHRLVYQVQ
ncbi:DUF418 domain-containing protein [Cellvibrio sp. UBA7661]|uniref:DUF418 domain-containing protein n=1 Tax=Cellvibrio sp. UBA7661 TaxID=1946311 RepID=UPI002F3604C2